MDIEKGKYIEHILPTRVSLSIWLIDDYTREGPSGYVNVLIDGSYLFNWNEIPGTDEDKLIKLLERDFGINWAQPDNITKPDDSTLVVSDGNRTISLTLNDEKTKATRTYLKIDDGRTDEFIVRMDNNVPKIYRERNIAPIRNLSGYYVFNDLASGSFEISVKSDYYFFEKRTIDTTRINNPDVSLEFDTNGRPAKGALSAILNDTSKLESGDIIELRNPAGDMEQRMINSIDNGTKIISWVEPLIKDYRAKYSNISILRYLPLVIVLKPNPSYPFPDNATLVRGYASNTVPVKDALVKVLGDTLITITDKNGEFVLYFRDKTERTITINISKGTVISVPDVNLMIGGTISLGMISFP
jgi:hypothetical protein